VREHEVGRRSRRDGALRHPEPTLSNGPFIRRSCQMYWRWKTHQRSRTPGNVAPVVWTMAFSPDGARATVALQPGSLEVWDPVVW
jgi:hypothetical protein